ncbi:MAG: 3'-5' exonuclease [Myxococcales bacterium]|nr:3'-5' exonuclease [Myxococcales bacterium]
MSLALKGRVTQIRRFSLGVLAALSLLVAGSASRLALAAPTLQQIRARLRRAPRQPGGHITPGHYALIRGKLTAPDKADARKNIRLAPGVHEGQFREPTFRGKHPMFRRLVRQGWFVEKQGERAKLQKLANALEQNKRFDRNTPLRDVEFVSFDLEATGQAAGRWDNKRRGFFSGWGEITQFGYTVHKNGKIVDRGTINIKPDARIRRVVTDLNGNLNALSLRDAPRFEKVAEKILKVLSGRVLVGQSAQKNDWGWLRSNFARLGVDLPKQSGMILDTFLMSHNHFKKGAGVETMAQTWNIPLVGAHDAQVDAKATAAAFFKMLALGGAKTLGDAFKLQAVGMKKMHNLTANARERAKVFKAAAHGHVLSYLAQQGIAQGAQGVGISPRGQSEDGRSTRVRVSVAGERHYVLVNNKTGQVTPEGDAPALQRALGNLLGR